MAAAEVEAEGTLAKIVFGLHGDESESGPVAAAEVELDVLCQEDGQAKVPKEVTTHDPYASLPDFLCGWMG